MSQQPKATRTQQRHELDIAKLANRARMAMWDKTFRLLKFAIGCATLSFCAYQVHLSVDSLAGHDTNALVSFIGDLSMDRWAAYALTGITGVGWIRERRLRRRTNEEKAEHIKKLESRLAPERSSSGLLKDGRAKPEDIDA